MSLVITSSGVRKVYKPCDFSKVPSIEEVADIFAGIAKGFDFKPITLSGESQPSEGQGDWSENEFTGIAPPNSEQGEGDNSAALAVCIKLLETWKHAGPLGSNQFEKFDVVIREARKVVDESALPNGNTTHDTSKPSDICPACDGTGKLPVS